MCPNTDKFAETDGGYCPHCGHPATPDGALDTAADAATGRGHGACDSALLLEPPRFCSTCARRLKVQVDPFGWQASCSRHGDLTGS